MKEGSIWIYALRLEGEKCYVGQTKRPRERLGKHFEGNGSAWTSRHRPIEVIFLKETGLTSWRKALELESAVTLQMAKVFGAANVRGGRWSACDPRIGETAGTGRQ